MARDRWAKLSLWSALVLASACAYAAPGTEPAPQEGPKTVLAPGDPPLTMELSDRATDFIEWLLDVPLTDAQRGTIREGLVEAWTGNDRSEVQGVLDLLQLEAQVKALDEPARLKLREQLQPTLIQQLRQQPDDEASQWLLAIYEAGHQPIADGDPPLTRQVSDAYAELICFMVSQGLGQEGFEAPTEFKDEFAKTLAAGYPKLTAEERKDLAQMPLAWAAVRAEWARLPDEQKQQYRAQWGESLKALMPAQPAEQAQPAAQPAPATGAQTQAGGQQAGLSAIQQSLAASQRAQIMSNIMQMQYETSRAIISNIGGGGWRYEYRY